MSLRSVHFTVKILDTESDSEISKSVVVLIKVVVSNSSNKVVIVIMIRLSFFFFAILPSTIFAVFKSR